MDFELGEDELMFRDTVRQFCRADVVPHAEAWDGSGEFPAKAVAKLGEMGLMGMDAPETYGGVELSTVASAVAVEELAAADGSLALTVSSHNSLCIGHIALRGTDAQKQRWLPALASGEALGAWALTEEGAGSDVSAVRLRAVPEGDGFVLSGTKRLVNQGSVAKHIVVIASTDPDAGAKGLSAFVVDREAAGVSTSEQIDKLGVRAADTVDVTFAGVRVGADSMLGEPGQGLADALAVLERGRIAVAAMACGLGRGAMETATAYATDREQFGKPIANFQAIQWKLANMQTELAAAWLLTLKAAALRDGGKPFGVAASRAKLFAANAAVRACNDAIQIHGGYGYVREFPVERALRDARLTRIGSGTDEMLRLVVSRDIVSRFEAT